MNFIGGLNIPLILKRIQRIAIGPCKSAPTLQRRIGSDNVQNLGSVTVNRPHGIRDLGDVTFLHPVRFRVEEV